MDEGSVPKAEEFASAEEEGSAPNAAKFSSAEDELRLLIMQSHSLLAGAAHLRNEFEILHCRAFVIDAEWEMVGCSVFVVR